MKKCNFITLLLLFSATNVSAGGILLYETGTPEVGLASAGWAARAQDAATVFTNPAGMTRLDGNQLMLGVQALYGDLTFTPYSSDMGAESDNAVGWFPGMSVNYSHSISDDFKLGAAIYGNFGLGMDFGTEWAGERYIQEATTIGITFAPTMAYRINSHWSIGVGLNLMYGYFKTESGVTTNNSSTLEIEDSQLGIGGNFGVLYELNENTRFGLQYTTPISLDFEDEPTIKGASLGVSPTLELDMTVPQTVMLSGFHQLNPCWAVMGNLGWQDWSSFGRIDTVIKGNSFEDILIVERDYDDTFHIAIGAQYRPEKYHEFSGGLAYDSSNVDDQNRSFTNPVGDQYRLGLGYRYFYNEDITFGFSYEFLWEGSNEVTEVSLDNQTENISGEFEGTYFHFFAFNVNVAL